MRLTILLATAAVSCGGAITSSLTDGGTSAVPMCTAGQPVACVGAGACQGGQVCSNAGSSYGLCQCGSGADGAPSGSDAAPDVVADAPGDSSGNTIIAAPRQIAPLSTATVTSQRPTFRWALASRTDGARIDICRDRACTMVVTTFTATGRSGAPAGALAAGLYFWRVHGTANGGVGAATSAVWQFTVGARNAPQDTSWGTTLDVNGDGFADLVVGAYAVSLTTGRAYVYLGSPLGLGASPATTLTGPDGVNGGFGRSVASAGDVNGDGFTDLVVGEPGFAGSPPARAYIYLGSASGVAASPATTLTGPDGANADFGISVASAGDVNGDGFADLVVAANSFGPNVATIYTGRAYVYFGSASGLATNPATTLTGLDGFNGDFGISVASAGDANGDGFADLVVGADGAYGINAPTTKTGRTYVYFGSTSGLAASPSTTLTGPDGANGHFGISVASAEDANGNGFASRSDRPRS